MGIVWVWRFQSNPHGYGSPGDRRPESKRTLAHPLSQISCYATDPFMTFDPATVRPNSAGIRLQPMSVGWPVSRHRLI